MIAGQEGSGRVVGAPRAGDMVYLSATGETWLVAAVETAEDGITRFIPTGWPIGTHVASEAVLVKQASDQEHLDMIQQTLAFRGDHGETDPRALINRKHRLRCLTCQASPQNTFLAGGL